MARSQTFCFLSGSGESMRKEESNPLHKEKEKAKNQSDQESASKVRLVWWEREKAAQDVDKEGSL